jgi:hypothetical protein
MLGLFAALVASVHPGIEMELSEAGFNYFAGVAAPMIEAKIKTIAIPSMSGEKDSISYSVTNIKVNALTLDNVKIASAAGKGLSLSVKPLGISISADWSYREDVWPHVPNGGGSLTASVGGSSSVKTAVALTAGTDGKPHSKHVSTAVSIDSFDVKVHGSILSWLYDLIVDAFKSTLKDKIESSASDAVNSFWDSTVNTLLSKYATVLPLSVEAPYDVAQVDDSVVEVTSLADRLTFGVLGEVQALANATRKIAPYPHAASPFAPNPPGSAMVRIKLSPFVLKSAAWTFFEYGLVAYEILPSMVPASSPIKLNTADVVLAGLAPGLAKSCPAQNVTVRLNGSAVPNESEAPSGIGLDVPLDFIFDAPACGAANKSFALRCGGYGLSAEVKAWVTRETIMANVSYISCEIEEAWSDVGPIEGALLISFVCSLLFCLLISSFVRVARSQPLGCSSSSTYSSPPSSCPLLTRRSQRDFRSRHSTASRCTTPRSRR